MRRRLEAARAWRGWAVGLVLVLYPALARACDFCRPRVQAGIFDAHFAGRVGLTLLPLVVVLLLVALIVRGPWARGGARRPEEDAWS